jgi:hypothetical protein
MDKKRLSDFSDTELETYRTPDCPCTRYPCRRICPCGREGIGKDIVTAEERTLAERLGPETIMRWMKGKQWN